MLCSNCASSIEIDEPRVEKRFSYTEKVLDLEKEILDIENMMESLAKRRTMLQRNINILSLPSLLPAEILTEIFRLACQSSSPSFSSAALANNDGIQRPLTPLFFGSVCKEWREIAWLTPLLWNSLSLHVPRKTNSSHSQAYKLSLLRDWLMRAKSSPLHIKLTMDDEHEPNFSSLRAIMEVLATRSLYWSSLDSLLPSQCNDILKDNHFPALTSVSIRPPKGSISTFSEPPNMFHSAPKLLDVDLSGYNFSGMVLPWNQLRRFKTQFLTVGECLKVLHRSPNLKECHLESVYSPELNTASTPLSSILSSSTSTTTTTTTTPIPLRASELQILDVVLIKSSAISLLDNVVLPSLADLRVQYSGPGGSLLSAITALVIRSSCRLQRLHVEKKSFHEDDLIPCLESLSSSLAHLRLVTLGGCGSSSSSSSVTENATVVSSSSSTPAFAGTGTGTASTGLTPRLTTMLHPSYHDGNPLLPLLQTFEYRGPIRCDEDSLLALVAGRWRVRVRDQDQDFLGSPRTAQAKAQAKAKAQASWNESTSISRIARLDSITVVSSDVARLSAEFAGEVSRLANEGMVLDIRSA